MNKIVEAYYCKKLKFLKIRGYLSEEKIKKIEVFSGGGYWKKNRNRCHGNLGGK